MAFCALKYESYLVAFAYAALAAGSFKQLCLSKSGHRKSISLKIYLTFTVALCALRAFDFWLYALDKFSDCLVDQSSDDSWRWGVLGSDLGSTLWFGLLSTLPAAFYFSSYSGFWFSLSKVYDSFTRTNLQRIVSKLALLFNFSIYLCLMVYYISWSAELQVLASFAKRAEDFVLTISSAGTSLSMVACGLSLYGYIKSLDVSADSTFSARVEKINTRGFHLTKLVVVYISCIFSFSLRALLLFFQPELSGDLLLNYFIFLEVLPIATMLYVFWPRSSKNQESNDEAFIGRSDSQLLLDSLADEEAAQILALDEAYFGGESHGDLLDDPTKRGGGGPPAATGAVGGKDSQEPVSAVSRVFGQRRRSNTQLPSTMAGGKTKRGPLPLLRLAARNLVFTNCGSVRSVYHFAALYSIFKALLSKFKFGKRMKIFLGLVALLHELSREAAVQERAREAARLDLLGQDPASGLSVQYPTWLNSVLQEVWPSLEPNLSASIGAAISTSVAKDPDHDNYTFVGISDFTLGSTPPLIRYVSVLTQPNAHLLAARPYNVSSVALSHFRNNTNDGKRFVYAELGLDYRGKDSQISVKMGKTKIRKKAWWESDRDVRRRLNKSYIPTSATIVLSSVVVQMKVVLAMELSKNLEPDYLFLSFVETPRIRFGLKPLGAFDLTKLPGLGSGIQYGIERVLRGFTSPAYYELDLLTAEEKAALRDSVLQDIVDMASGGASGGTLKGKPKKRKAGHQHQQRRHKRVDKDKRDPHGVVSDKEEKDALNYDPRLVWKNEKDSPRRVKKQKSQQQQQQQQSMKQKSSSKKAMLVEECTFGTAVKNQKSIELEKDHIVQQQSPDSVKKFQNVQQSNKDHQQGLLTTINVVPYLL